MQAVKSTAGSTVASCFLSPEQTAVGIEVAVGSLTITVLDSCPKHPAPRFVFVQF